MSASADDPTQTHSDTELHPADPAERKRTIAALTLATIVGVLLLMALQNELANIQGRLAAGDMELSTGRFVLLARGCFVLLALVGLVTGAVITQGALAAIREQRFPHSQASLLFARKIVRGERAILMGRMALLAALGFVLVGCAGAVLGWRLLSQFH